ncbi:Hypothetical protein SMAX5B_001837 [Scophthalmus maximus]|uniref:Uncharacterized protein n=1 Tax=Scophthalmus maximus TaxID=52904 RepID=A0A2U9BPS8_SCOMX|nr:Hypothetical protein SMAX5B_001837 [Scophthalmus maximus]
MDVTSVYLLLMHFVFAQRNEPGVNQEWHGSSQKLPETSRALSPLNLGPVLAPVTPAAAGAAQRALPASTREGSAWPDT